MGDYLIVCGCTGEVAAIAFLDDNRDSGGRVTFRPVSGASDAVLGAGVATARDQGAMYRALVAGYADHAVSEAIWPRGTSWVVRCPHCKRQAQIGDAAALVDTLDTGEDWAVVPAGDDGRKRSVVPLGVLCRIIAGDMG